MEGVVLSQIFRNIGIYYYSPLLAEMSNKKQPNKEQHRAIQAEKPLQAKSPISKSALQQNRPEQSQSRVDIKIIEAAQRAQKKDVQKKDIEQYMENSNISDKSEHTSIEYNVEFYLNKRQSQPMGDTIDNIHRKWWGNYDHLEKHHGYIQWLFPNSYKSRFNDKAHALTLAEAQKFQSSRQISTRYVESYKMMLEFYGIKLRCKKTGELTRSRKPKYEERYAATLLTSFHNHMRITRILSSLVMTGFGRYAKHLSLFLNEEINGTNGAMRALKKYGVYEREWKQYADFVEKEGEISDYFNA